MKIAFSLFVYICLTLNCFAAGWDTNVWGNANTNGITAGTGLYRYYIDASTNKVYVKDRMAEDAYSALVERADIAGVARPSTNVFFRSSRANLYNIKQYIRTTLASKFYNTNVFFSGLLTPVTNELIYTSPACSDSDTSTSDVTSTNDYRTKNSVPSNRAWSDSTIVSELGLPVNYFSTIYLYTPWRSIVSTNHVYGWHAIDDIINLLTFPILTGDQWSNNDETNLYSRFMQENQSWSTAKTQAESGATKVKSTTASPVNVTLGQVRYLSFGGTGCRYGAEFTNRYAYPVAALNSSASNYHANLSFYAEIDQKDDAYNIGNPLFFNEPYFDAQGGVFTNSSGFYLLSSVSNVPSTGTYTSTVVVGDTSLSLPTWATQPDGTTSSTDPVIKVGSTYYHVTSLGWQVKRMEVFADYVNSTNGLSFYLD